MVKTFAALSLAALVSAQAPPPVRPTLGRILRDHPRLDALLASDARVEVLGSGISWAEGPVWVKDGGYLLFSDIPRNSVMKWKDGEGLSVFLKPAGYTGVGDYSKEP